MDCRIKNNNKNYLFYFLTVEIPFLKRLFCLLLFLSIRLLFLLYAAPLTCIATKSVVGVMLWHSLSMQVLKQWARSPIHNVLCYKTYSLSKNKTRQHQKKNKKSMPLLWIGYSSNDLERFALDISVMVWNDLESAWIIFDQGKSCAIE